MWCVTRRTIFWRTLLIIFGRTGKGDLDQPGGGGIRRDQLGAITRSRPLCQYRWWPSTREPGARTPQQTSCVAPVFWEAPTMRVLTAVSRYRIGDFYV